MESYAAGETTPALLEETIGANFERTVADHPDREALVEVATGRRWTYAELDRDVDAWRAGCSRPGSSKGDRVGIWAPNCAEWTITQYATAKIGAILVNVNPSYRTHELALRRQPVGHADAGHRRRSSRPATTASMIEETAGQNPRLERVVYLDTDDWSDLAATAGHRPPTPSTSGCTACGRRPGQHPVHLGHHRLPQGRDPVATATSSTTAT